MYAGIVSSSSVIFLYFLFTFYEFVLLGARCELTGTVGDYLISFYVKYLNPQAEEDEAGWVAEGAVRMLKRRGENQLYELSNIAVVEARHNYLNFLSTGQITDELLKSTLSLAKLDPLIAGYNN